MIPRPLALGAALCVLVFQPVFGAVSPGAPASIAAPVSKSTVSTSDDIAEMLRPRYANGIVAIAEGKVITVKDVVQELTPQQVNGIRASSRTEAEFNKNIELAQETIIQNLIDRELVIKEFRKVKPGMKEVRKIPDNYIDQEIASQEHDDFGDDRPKFLAYIQSLGLTRNEYRKKIEEDIIFRYMLGQQRQSQSIVSPVKIETYYNENKEKFMQSEAITMRLLQIKRKEGQTDDQMRAQLNGYVAEFKGGTKFEELVRSYSEDTTYRTKGGLQPERNITDLSSDFEKPANDLKKGEISAPIMVGEYGFLIYAEDRKSAGLQPLTEVHDEIERMLNQQTSIQARERWLERLRRDAFIVRF
jgi:peptidyl-prolyl cis-trans isomerase SurA